MLTRHEVEARGFTAVEHPIGESRSKCGECAFSVNGPVDGLTCSRVHCASISWRKHEGNAHVRNTDPDTSKQAEVQTRTKRASIKDHILLTLAIRPSTGTEIASRNYLRLNSVTPRFAELVTAGRIKDSGARRNREIVWELA